MCFIFAKSIGLKSGFWTAVDKAKSVRVKVEPVWTAISRDEMRGGKSTADLDFHFSLN